jgi:hypothetical protein
MKAKAIIAATFGLDSGDVEDYRYQPSRTQQPIYAIDSYYFACGKRKPKDEVGAEWQIHKDQFWAEQNKTVLWNSKAL